MPRIPQIGRQASVLPWLVGLAIILGGCGQKMAAHDAREATSLLGQPLFPPSLESARRAELEARLEAARSDYENAPHDETAAIWYGRRLAYLSRFRQAIDVFTAGLRNHPDSHRLLRHRGHRFITLRQFDAAIADLARAAELVNDVPDEIEPDGQPHAQNQPRSTTNGNIYYHLGLARYLRGEFAQAAAAYQRSFDLARNDDMRCAALNWLYLSLRRCHRADAAQALLDGVSPDMDVIENVAYHRLLLVYTGQRKADEMLADFPPGSIEWITAAYGVGAWRQIEGERESANSLFQRIVASENWPSFGFIAAEAELARSAP